MTKSDFKTPDFRKMAEEALRDMPKDVGEKARAFFLQSFIKEGFTDNSFIAWPKRKDKAPHKLLSQSLALRNSITVDKATLDQIVVSAGKGLPYAAIHNSGGTISVKVTDRMRKYFWYMHKKTGQAKYKWMALTKKERFSIHIPKRQYIGESYTLNQKIDHLFIEAIKKGEKRIRKQL